MATQALDIITILHALNKLDQELGVIGLEPKNPEQEYVFGLLNRHRENLAKLTNISAKASLSWIELNNYLEEHGFSRMVRQFDPSDGIGVVSILDMLVSWLYGACPIIEIETARGNRPGFEINSNGVNIYAVDGYPYSYLLELKTNSANTPWLFTYDARDLKGVDLVKLSIDVMGSRRAIPTMRTGWQLDDSPVFQGAHVPMLDFRLKPDIGWLVGAGTATSHGRGRYYIAQAAQEFMLRMDQTGARVKAATALVAMRSLNTPSVFVVDGPVYGWWTQDALPDLPMAVFFADWDAMRKPTGSFEDL